MAERNRGALFSSSVAIVRKGYGDIVAPDFSKKSIEQPVSLNGKFSMDVLARFNPAYQAQQAMEARRTERWVVECINRSYDGK